MSKKTSYLSNKKFDTYHEQQENKASIFKYVGESIIGTLVTFFIGFPLYYLDLFYPFLGTNMGLYSACGILIIGIIYTVTGLVYFKYRFFSFVLFLVSLLIIKPYVYILFALLFSGIDAGEADTNAFGYIMVTIYALWVILYGLFYDLIKWLNLRRNRVKIIEGNTTAPSIARSSYMLIIATLFVLALMCNMYYEQDKRYPLQYKIEDYFIENKESFNILLEEVLGENKNFANWNLEDHTQKIVINDKIDKMMKKLKIYEIAWHHNQRYENVNLQFKVDLKSSIPAFELWYNKEDNGNGIYPPKEGRLAGISWVDGWLIYMHENEISQ